MSARLTRHLANPGRRISYGPVGARERMSLWVNGKPSRAASKHRRYLGRDVEVNLAHGIAQQRIDAYASILRRPCRLEDAIAGVDALLRDAAASAMRMLMIGIVMERQHRRAA